MACGFRLGVEEAIDRISSFLGDLPGEKGGSKLLSILSTMLGAPDSVSGSSGIVSRDRGLAELAPLRTDSLAGDLMLDSLSPATEAALEDAALGVVGVARDLLVVLVVPGLVVRLEGRFVAEEIVDVAPPSVVLLLLVGSGLTVREVVGVVVRDNRRLSVLSAALPSSVVLRTEEAVGRVAADGAFGVVVEVREERVLDRAVDGEEAGLAADELSREDVVVVGFFLSSVVLVVVVLAGVLAPVVLALFSMAVP